MELSPQPVGSALMTAVHVRIELNCKTESQGPPGIGELLGMEKTHTSGVRSIVQQRKQFSF